MKYAAIIEATPYDTGFEWGDPDFREHHLLSGETWSDVARAAASIFPDIPDRLARTLETELDESAVAALIERLFPQSDYVTGEYDPNVGIDISNLPSMGDGDCWGDDDWLGAADYLSYGEWCRILNRDNDYTLPDDMDQDVRNYLGL